MTRPLLCATVTAATTQELRRRRDAVRDADLIELRLDGVRDVDVPAALAGCATPLIVTCRPAWEGGQFRGSEAERHAILAEAMSLGAAWVDVEWRAGFDDLVGCRGGRGVVLSMHDLAGVPPDLTGICAAMRATGAEVVKLAVRVCRLSDSLRLRELTRDARAKTVVVGIGPAGSPTRVLAARFGSCWTYAGDAVPGQLPVTRLLDEYRFRSVTSATRVYGIAGAPLEHSLSPALHNACFAALGVDAVCVPLHSESADDVLTFADAMDIRGIAVTAPLKVAVTGRMHRLDDMAARVGAANTITRQGDEWIGRNTDVAGFLEPLAGREDLVDARAAILGCGGAARSVAVALASAGARITVYGRQLERAAGVARLVGGDARTGIPARRTWDVLVNATPVGTIPNHDQTPIPAGHLGGGLVYDLVYNPPVTRLIREAREAGCRAIGGLDMLVAQAALQAEWWNGRDAPVAAMRAAAVRRLAAGDEPALGGRVRRGVQEAPGEEAVRDRAKDGKR
jgi:3-dehydroquinate dehydratase / shikimate dehydrogenase